MYEDGYNEDVWEWVDDRSKEWINSVVIEDKIELCVNISLISEIYVYICTLNEIWNVN